MSLCDARGTVECEESSHPSDLARARTRQDTIDWASSCTRTIWTATNSFFSLQVRKTQHAYKPRASLQPGTVLILLAGRFRGKRVVLLKTLPQGVLLVTGPFKVNGVPIRRVNARYVIATRTTVDVSAIDSAVVDKVSSEGYFAREKKSDKTGEEAFFKQGEKPEVWIPHLPRKHTPGCLD